MKQESHRRLGRYLMGQLPQQPKRRHSTAFFIGCVEPDRNPITYLKGSLRFQWLRGHNYRNARRFMRRISQRLEGKTSLNLFDFYTLGKLIHYTTDAFTSAHNDTFPTNLMDHRVYEVKLQEHFLRYLEEDPQVNPRFARTIMDAVYSYHKEYERHEADIHTDARFALTACCSVVSVLLPKPAF